MHINDIIQIIFVEIVNLRHQVFLKVPIMHNAHPVGVRGTVKGNQLKQEKHQYSAFNCPLMLTEAE